MVLIRVLYTRKPPEPLWLQFPGVHPISTSEFQATIKPFARHLLHRGFNLTKNTVVRTDAWPVQQRATSGFLFANFYKCHDLKTLVWDDKPKPGGGGFALMYQFIVIVLNILSLLAVGCSVLAYRAYTYQGLFNVLVSFVSPFGKFARSS